MKPDFSKYNDGLVPAIIQDASSGKVLMLGYMNEEAYQKTVDDKRVTFFSRSKNRLWTKGETSKNYLDVMSMALDCDQDAILIKAHAHGPTCHTGSESCFDANSSNEDDEMLRFPASPAGKRKSEILKQVQDDKFTINDLEKTIHQRIDDKVEGSYTYSLIQKGINKVAQKVGEEAVETVIDAINGKDEDFLYEAGDLMYHYLVLLKAKGYSLADIEVELAKRHGK
ncbi:bifunctional phosphoribosyl-AMP cyclohydrolase/phosphoribosyl-ATP diphosphatase HisIE [Nonlabens ponticola]|uniref:Histidine biosynthesis bifunctional protein HisIE n=1 Tax=Nonlabens ponticola TaxID=2496866 RepID=A0A3S9N1K5_9FLAO|nr:bifunctional phosphoribosyl-AMP cyclohydrolase/phosphoribosyl-ATP diphosphatase HisIE [Nonlabens ponticola]AZQ45254.1 bifunctional phosphoribosyl-AMP cyclohydrolase/phosphoribosyl-ATP diphosphatase HisIE [Nonlabens ponticola]